MTVPTTVVYSAAALTAAHTGFAGVIDSGSGAGYINVRDAAGALLAHLLLTDPCGSVNSATGRLTLSMAGPSTWSASGTAAYAEICDSSGAVHAAMPCAAGTVAAPGYLVLNTLAAVGGGAVTVTSAVMG